MSLSVFTDSPEDLLKKIRDAIDSGHIETWSYDRDGDFTHTPQQWKSQAWLRPYSQQGVLMFGLFGRNDVVMTKVIYAVYHGRFAEMLLSHFDKDFKNILSTALGDGFDNYKAATP